MINFVNFTIGDVIEINNEYHNIVFLITNVDKNSFDDVVWYGIFIDSKSKYTSETYKINDKIKCICLFFDSKKYSHFVFINISDNNGYYTTISENEKDFFIKTL